MRTPKRGGMSVAQLHPPEWKGPSWREHRISGGSGTPTLTTRYLCPHIHCSALRHGYTQKCFVPLSTRLDKENVVPIVNGILLSCEKNLLFLKTNKPLVFYRIILHKYLHLMCTALEHLSLKCGYSYLLLPRTGLQHPGPQHTRQALHHWLHS